MDENKSKMVKWFPLINVVESLQKALEMGWKSIHEIKNKEGNLQFAIVEDPAGAVFGLANA
ncbi:MULTISPECIES: hypothetical protein [Empedobacter]|uniref:hypothetical protein n=1 Tax=Empedobacter TaxID=59734 RepID=UPI0025BDBF56|nr:MULTISPECIES: hypothetical protein [unclassified Empedobacter]